MNRNYRRYNYNRNSYTKPKTFSVYSYIENEFFNADDELFHKISNLYRNIYGERPYRYLLNTYNSWKRGSVKTSRQTMKRIFECVPRFLSDEKRFIILKNEILFFIKELHSKQIEKDVSLIELNSLFKNYNLQIEDFEKSNMPYMASDKIFKVDEIEQFLNVCKYVLKEKLKLVYNQVKNDIILIKEKLSTFNTGIFQASYKINFLKSTIDISLINDIPLNFIQIQPNQMELSGRYKEYAENYILNELIKLDFSEKNGKINSYVKSVDFDFFISQYETLFEAKRSSSLQSEFNGEGGILDLKFEVKVLKSLYTSILYSIIKTFGYFILIIAAIFSIFEFNLYESILLLIIGTLIIGSMLISASISEIKSIKESLTDINRYGK